MKKYLKFFMLMLLVFSYSYSGVMPETDWKIKNLKGKVKSMVKTEYEYNSSGKIEKTWVTETYFNEQGYITNEVQYVNNRLNQSIIYKNNSDGLPIKKDEVSRVYSYKYEETKDGNLLVTIKEENVDNENFPLLEKITYNKNGKKVHHLVYSGKELIVDDMYIYNEKGNLIEIKQGVSKDVKDNRFRENSIKITYNYKANGDYEKTTEIATAKWTYLYDKNGNEQEYISMIKTGSEGKTKISIYLKFKDITRDEHGNLTRSTSVRYDYSKKKEKGIYKRLENKYEYYD
ncbi:Type IV secretion protein Rhs [Fusobacterium sp. oral taxon C10]